jgi:hypothetical protein
MKTLRDLIFAIFVSPEFFIIALCFAGYQITPSWFELLGSGLSRSAEALKWLSLAPAAVLVFALKSAKETLLPTTVQAEILAQWPEFWVVKNRVLVGLLYVFVTACMTVGLWISGANIARASLSAVYTAALAINLTAAGTLWYASVQVGIRLRRLKIQES